MKSLTKTSIIIPLKPPIKKQFTATDIFLILVNLLPLWGVWFRGWDAKQIFLVYCLESVIIGLYNVLMMLLTTFVKKKDIWTNGSYSALVSGYWFVLFFIIHYGFFLAVQIGIFLSISNFNTDTSTVKDFFYALHHLTLNAQTPPAVWLILIFIATHGILVLKDFILTGNYKRASLGVLLFAPYARVFVQQFCVLIGGFFLQFGAGKIFILVFVVVKIFFESVLDYQKMLTETAKAEQAD